jgi:hypothetical protein
MVGLINVLQQTPLADIVAPPISVTFPPLVAVLQVIFETAAVIKIGRVAFSFLHSVKIVPIIMIRIAR